MASSTRTHRPARKSSTNRWSARVTRTSNALDLDRDVFTWKDPRKIALAQTLGRTQSPTEE